MGYLLIKIYIKIKMLTRKRKHDLDETQKKKQKLYLKWQLSSDLLGLISEFINAKDYHALLLTCVQWSSTQKKQFLIKKFYSYSFGSDNINDSEIIRRFNARRNIIKRKKKINRYTQEPIQLPDAAQHGYVAYDHPKHVVMNDQETLIYDSYLGKIQFLQRGKIKYLFSGSNYVFNNFHFNHDYLAGLCRDPANLKIFDWNGRLIREYPYDHMYWAKYEDIIKIHGNTVCYVENNKLQIGDIRQKELSKTIAFLNCNKLLFDGERIYTIGIEHRLRIFDIRKNESFIVLNNYDDAVDDICLSQQKLYTIRQNSVKVWDNDTRLIDLGINIPSTAERGNRIYGYEDMLFCNAVSRTSNYTTRTFEYHNTLYFIDGHRRKVYQTLRMPTFDNTNTFDSIACNNSKVVFSYQTNDHHNKKAHLRRSIVESYDFDI